jgi:hypothetical protein
MTATEALERRIDELCSENERLRQDNERFIIKLNAEHIVRQNVEAENDRLRKLVAQRTAKRVVVSNSDTDHATGHTACGVCGGAIDFWDAYCRHCGANLEEDA